MNPSDISHTSGQLRIGQPVQRLEDQALLTGTARFIDDLELPGAAHAAFVRSPHVHARVLSVDISAAVAAPEVLGVFTAADLAAAGLKPMSTSVVQKNRDGSPIASPASTPEVSGGGLSGTFGNTSPPLASAAGVRIRRRYSARGTSYLPDFFPWPKSRAPS